MRLSSSEAVYRLVKEKLLRGELPGGELLSEGDIAQQAGVSRTPVREAFLRLETEGWLRLYPKRGALVIPVKPGEIENVLSARQLIESYAVQQLSASTTDLNELISSLNGITTKMHIASSRADMDTFTALDAEFHGEIVRASGNETLFNFYRTLREQQQRMTTISVWNNVERIDGILKEHTELVRIVSSRDASAYSTALMEHMCRTHLPNRSSPLSVVTVTAVSTALSEP